MKETIENKLIAVCAVVAAVLLIVAVVAIRNTRRAEGSSDWVNHTHAVILETDAIRTALYAAESAVRDYVLTGDPRDQAAYREAFAEALEHLGVARALTGDNPRQQATMGQVEELVGRRVEFARRVATARSEQGFEAARGLVAGDMADQTLRDLRRHIQQFKAEQAELLQERDRENYRAARATRLTLYTGVAVDVVLLALIFALIRDDLRQRRAAAAALQAANDLLEQKVKERTAELAQSNESLTLENLERKWSQAALERQWRHSEQILNSIGDAIFVVSRSCKIIRMNPGAARFSGWPAHELVGEQIDRVLAFGPGAGGGDPLPESLRTGREIGGLTAEMRVRDGRVLPVLVKAFPVRDDDHVVGAVVVCSQA